MKISFITDLHIDGNEHFPLDKDTRQQFINVLNRVVSGNNCDLLILGGDLCNKVGDTQVYLWIKHQLDICRIPYLVIPGNHDESKLLAHVFDYQDKIHDGEIYYITNYGQHEFIFLDTSKGYMSLHQWAWLESRISVQNKEVFIFMHHPPIRSGSKHMEPKYMFEQMNLFEQLCQKYQQNHFYIFSGHYHLERTLMKNNVTLFITPSTFVQVDPDSEVFYAFNDLIGYREIQLTDDHQVITNVIYL